MSDQPPTLLDLLDTSPARVARDHAIDTVEANAHDEWLATADRIVRHLAAVGLPFTTDDVWSRLDARGVTTHEPRALGAVIRKAARRGLIATTGDYRKSVRPECHARPVAVWKGRP